MTPSLKRAKQTEIVIVTPAAGAVNAKQAYTQASWPSALKLRGGNSIGPRRAGYVVLEYRCGFEGNCSLAVRLIVGSALAFRGDDHCFRQLFAKCCRARRRHRRVKEHKGFELCKTREMLESGISDFGPVEM
jgi:hypothetical protein